MAMKRFIFLTVVLLTAPTAAWAQSAGALEFKTGSELVKKGDYPKAYKIFIVLAENGHAASQYNVGIMF
jgi:TPR repeat protein